MRPHGFHGILQARILEWVAFPFSKGSSQPRDRTQVSHIAGGFFTSVPPGKLKNTRVGSLSLLQQIFPTQESNQGLSHFRQILYQLRNLEKLNNFPKTAAKVKVKVTQSWPILFDPTDYTVHGILQVRMLEWVAFSFCRGSSQPRDRTQVFCIAGGFFTS